IDRNAFESESVPHETHTNARVLPGAPVDHGIADERGLRGRRGGRRHQMPQARGVGLARERPVAADDPIVGEKGREIKASQNTTRRVERLVGQDGQRGTRAELAEHFGNAAIRTSAIEKMLVIDREESIERVGRRLTMRLLERAPDERRGALADQPSNRFLRERLRAARGEQPIHRVRQIAARVDERTVEIENYQAGSYAVHGAEALDMLLAG